MIGAQCSQFTETVYQFSTQSGAVTIDWTNGSFQTITTGGAITFAFAATWPAVGYARLRLLANVVSTAHTITWPSAVSVNLSNIQGASGQTITFATPGNYEFELATYNGGTTIAIEDVLRNYNVETTGNTASFITANISGNLSVNGSIITYAGSGANLTLDPDGTADVVLTPNTGLWLLDPTPSTNTTSGALISYGGAGIAGNVYSGAYINAASGIVNSGTQIEPGYQQLKPTGNISVTANIGVNRVLLHPTGAIVSFGANVTLPNTQVDGTIISISSNVTIASLAVTPNWNGVVTVSPFGNVGPVTAGTVNRFIYIAADKIWYKIA